MQLPVAWIALLVLVQYWPVPCESVMICELWTPGGMPYAASVPANVSLDRW